MRDFRMCPECQAEYENPLDRRFHAQPNACPACGPHLELWQPRGVVIAQREEALRAAAEAIREGRILAIKGLGGFHLMVDARNETAVDRLRARKHREEKPLALMYPSLAFIREDCEVSQLEERLLAAPESPIVLLKKTRPASGSRIVRQIAPGNPYLGVMLPYTPLHHLLMMELGFPVVATSGNLSEEPICTDEREALERLHGIADLFLIHNRPIARHVDDSVVRIVLGRELMLRRARGYAPLPLKLKQAAPAVLAVGAHLKNTIALAVEDNVFISQHIGDLENQESNDAFQSVIRSFGTLYRSEPVHVVSDMHPDYLSTKFAINSGLQHHRVQHHYAHIASCMAENELEGPVLGVSWDGTGFGSDGTIWGGEFLLADLRSFQRIASLRKFRLPGGNQAIRQPRRSALGLLYEIFREGLFDHKDLPPLQSFTSQELVILRQVLLGGVNAPWTSSVGRLYDAVAALVGLRHLAVFEGQAAMELEFAIEGNDNQESYPFEIEETEPMHVNWERMIRAIIDDLGHGATAGTISARFHNALVEIIVAIAKRRAQMQVVLSGGCFQNRYLLERSVGRLRNEGFQVYWHQRVPPNDGGIALGQIAAATQILQGND
jgi:hydrogenase maturation protein HypF